MRRSLSHDQTTTPTPSAPPLSEDHDEDVQTAIEQSLADLQHSDPPPPYNPAYNPHEARTNQAAGTSGTILEAEIVIVGEGRVSESAELRRRGRTDNSTSTGEASTVAAHRTRSNHLDSVRAARLRKFGNTT